MSPDSEKFAGLNVNEFQWVFVCDELVNCPGCTPAAGIELGLKLEYSWDRARIELGLELE